MNARLALARQKVSQQRVRLRHQHEQRAAGIQEGAKGKRRAALLPGKDKKASHHHHADRESAQQEKGDLQDAQPGAQCSGQLYVAAAQSFGVP